MLHIDQRLIKYAAIGHTARVTNLLQKGASVGAENSAALKISMEKRFMNIARKLLEYGADPNITCSCDNCDDDNDGDNSCELTWLVRAIINVDIEMVTMLLEHGANVRANNDEALCTSVKRGCPETVQILLAHGANVHANDDEALRISAKRAHKEIVRALLEYGANVHANNDEALRTSYVNNPTIALLLVAHYDYYCGIFDELLECIAFSLEIKRVNIYSRKVYYGGARAGPTTIYFQDKFGEKIISVAGMLLEHGGNVHVNDDVLLKFLKENFHERDTSADISADTSADICDDTNQYPNFFKANFHRGDVHIDTIDSDDDSNNSDSDYSTTSENMTSSSDDAGDPNDPHLNFLKEDFYERLADVLLPYCGETDYQYFDPAYIARKIMPTKNSRTELIIS